MKKKYIIITIAAIVLIVVGASFVFFSRRDKVSQKKVIVFPLATEPTVLNPYLSNSGWESVVDLLINESLAEVDPNGNYYPVLAEDIPTRENGGVSEDELTITWKLKKGIVWSDGYPFTSQDVKYTWEAAKNPDNGVAWNPGVEFIKTIETPDDYTVRIIYNTYYPDYLGQFGSFNSGGQGIFPSHYCGNVDDMQNWLCNRNPIGTGPFMLKEWKSGQYISLVKNPRYRETGKPIVDEIYLPIVPDSSTHYQMLMKGDAHVWWFFDQQYLSDFASTPNVKIDQGSNQYSLRIFLNLNQRETNDENSPHPLLGDIRVRQAIRFAIDPNKISESVYMGFAKNVQNEVFFGKYVCPSPQVKYDPSKANGLLDQAGFIDTNNDGIRECKGCSYGKEGDPLELTLITSADEPPFSLVEQLLVDQLSQVGIKVVPKLDPNFEDAAISGNFDLMMWPDGSDPVSDPAALMQTYYDSQSIPQYNIMRYVNPNIDELFVALQTQKDYSERKQSICQIDNYVTQDVPVIFLFAVPYPSAFSSQIVGWQENPNALLTWDAENWDLLLPSK